MCGRVGVGVGMGAIPAGPPPGWGEGIPPSCSACHACACTCPLRCARRRTFSAGRRLARAPRTRSSSARAPFAPGVLTAGGHALIGCDSTGGAFLRSVGMHRSRRALALEGQGDVHPPSIPCMISPPPPPAHALTHPTSARPRAHTCMHVDTQARSRACRLTEHPLLK